MKLLRRLFYLLSPHQRILVRRLWYLPHDLFRKREPLVPPKGMIYTGAGDFIGIGDKMVNRIISECALMPDAKVLDIGCGVGRMARSFSAYLNVSGVYYGFDVVKTGVLWCNRNYKSYSNFHFKYVPVGNDLYNNAAQLNDWDFKFPYVDSFFDVAVSISVFTHMQFRGVENYMRETARVLKTGKCCVSTFFIMNEQRKLNFNTGKSFFKFEDGEQYLHDRQVKDANVAFDFAVIEKMAERSGMKILKFLPGWWDDGNKEKSFDFQDVLVLQKI